MPRISLTSALLTLSLVLAATATLFCFLHPREKAAEAIMAQARQHKKLLDAVEPILQNGNSRYYKEATALLEQEYALVRELARLYAVTRGLDGPEIHVSDMWGWGVTVRLDAKGDHWNFQRSSEELSEEDPDFMDYDEDA